jgi:hypothetical protein
LEIAHRHSLLADNIFRPEEYIITHKTSKMLYEPFFLARDQWYKVSTH